MTWRKLDTDPPPDGTLILASDGCVFDAVDGGGRTDPAVGRYYTKRRGKPNVAFNEDYPIIPVWWHELPPPPPNPTKWKK